MKNSPAPWYSITNAAADKPAEVLIYDVIGKETDWWSGEETGVGAQDFIEEVKALGEDKEIVVGINSPGGNVWDGLAIYNFLSNRRGKVRTRNDGLAASIASVILTAGKDGVEAPATSQTMVHDPSFFAHGSMRVEDLQKGIKALEAGKRAILAAYIKKTKRTEAELSALMTAETWMTGHEAQALGLVDVITNQFPIFNSFDLSRFKRAPESLRAVANKTAVQTAGKHQQPTNSMQDKIVALLKKHGAKVDDKATIEQLEAQLETLLTNKNGDASTDSSVSAKAMADLHNELKAIRDERDRERKARIENEVNACITENRIPANDKDFWVGQAMKDEAVLAKIKAMPQAAPAPEPGQTIDLVSADIRDVLKHVKRGVVNAAEKATLLRANHDKIVAGWHDSSLGLTESYKLRNEGTNTIDTTLKQDVILDQVLKAFSYKLTPLSLFSTMYQANPLRGSNKIQVPYMALQSAASTAWNASNGYVGGDTATDNKEITIDQRYYQAIRWTAEEIARQPYLLLAEHAQMNGEKLAYDVWVNVLGVVTVANYATAAYTGAASAFDSNDVIDLETAATNAKWPETGRFLFLNTSFDNALKKDNSVKLALNIGGSEVLRQGKLPNLCGFTYGRDANVPTNSENLAGFIGFKSAIAIANAPIAPTQEEVQAGLIYQTMTDPVTGLTLMSKRFGQPQMNRAFWVVEAAWGKAPLETAALQRIATA
jgi:ATP-dependent protease ClpP protease subunit